MNQRRDPLIQVSNLRKHFPIKKGIFGRIKGHVKAVDDISFDIYPQETLGLVGESGCGKTTAGRALLRLIEPTTGVATYKDTDIFKLKPADLRRVRRNLQIIFQDPFSSLNPRMTVENLVGEAMRIHGLATQDTVRDEVKALLERVGLQGSYVSRYPHEFSGGQRQRIGIARALALRPEFIVCDEAVSALDVSVQAQVINLLQDLQDEFKLAYLFIAHDLSVVRHISDRVAVMYLGRIAELAPCDEIYANPAHPYTQALLSAIPEANPTRVKERIILRGDVPTPINPPEGCRFHTRCPAAFARCKTEIPELKDMGAGHFVSCHLYDDPSTQGMDFNAAQRVVDRTVKASAETVLTNARRLGLDPRAKLADIDAKYLTEATGTSIVRPASESDDAEISGNSDALSTPPPQATEGADTASLASATSPGESDPGESTSEVADPDAHADEQEAGELSDATSEDDTGEAEHDAPNDAEREP